MVGKIEDMHFQGQYYSVSKNVSTYSTFTFQHFSFGWQSRVIIASIHQSVFFLTLLHGLTSNFTSSCLSTNLQTFVCLFQNFSFLIFIKVLILLLQETKKKVWHNFCETTRKMRSPSLLWCRCPSTLHLSNAYHP